MLEPVENAPDVGARADRRALTQLLTNGALNRIEFTTVDCDATFDLLVAAGTEVVQEPIDRRDGLLRFTQPGRQRATR